LSDPWFKFYPSDWLSGTRGLTAAETGIYITMIAMMYENEGPLSMDLARLARLCGCPKPSLLKCLETLVEDGKILDTEEGYWNEKVEKVRRDRQL